MIGHIAYAEGSPCPTLVLDRELLPRAEDELCEQLGAARRFLIGAGADRVLKIALISPSRHPLFDLDYKFVQVLPGAMDRFEFRGSCGHSILGSVLVASRIGWLSRLSPGHRVRVNVLNNGDNVVCEVDRTDRESSLFTVHSLYQPERRLGELLMTPTPTSRLSVNGRELAVSLVSAGNPYVFVSADEFGVSTQDELFADDPRLFQALVAVHDAAADLLGWPRTGAFPKVAATGRYAPGRLAVRAVSVPTWHPTLALTGATCIAIAAAIEGTVPHRLAAEAGVEAGPGSGALILDTPGGTFTVSAAVTGASPDDRVAWVSVDRKLVRHLGSMVIEPLQRLALKEAMTCLPLVT